MTMFLVDLGCVEDFSILTSPPKPSDRSHGPENDEKGFGKSIAPCRFNPGDLVVYIRKQYTSFRLGWFDLGKSKQVEMEKRG